MPEAALKRRIKAVLIELTAILNEMNDEPGEGSGVSPAPQTTGRIKPQEDLRSVSGGQAKLLLSMIQERWRGEPAVQERPFYHQFGCRPELLPAGRMTEAMAWLKTIPRLHEGVARG